MEQPPAVHVLPDPTLMSQVMRRIFKTISTSIFSYTCTMALLKSMIYFEYSTQIYFPFRDKLSSGALIRCLAAIPPRSLAAGASACMLCSPGSYSNSTGTQFMVFVLLVRADQLLLHSDWCVFSSTTAW